MYTTTTRAAVRAALQARYHGAVPVTEEMIDAVLAALPPSTLRIVVRHQSAGRAVRAAAGLARRYGPKFAVIEDRDMASGGGDDYPYAVATPYAYPYTERA